MENDELVCVQWSELNLMPLGMIAVDATAWLAGDAACATGVTTADKPKHNKADDNTDASFVLNFMADFLSGMRNYLYGATKQTAYRRHRPLVCVDTTYRWVLAHRLQQRSVKRATRLISDARESGSVPHLELPARVADRGGHALVG
ncbi:hypothetical protein [Actinomyces ruminis]|uniref:hypothetical protein n=1 Tax=Actinomyces ruminis TaxID=1937003 RepID=UPI00117808A4|nr:hypothetical protein [Actinomyces ruminis]